MNPFTMQLYMADIGSNCQLIAYLLLCDWNVHTSFMIIAEIGEMLYIFLSISWHRLFSLFSSLTLWYKSVFFIVLFSARIQTFGCISFSYTHNAWEIYFIQRYSWCLLHISFLAFHWTNDAIKRRINICYIEMFAIVAIFHHYSSLQNAIGLWKILGIFSQLEYWKQQLKHNQQGKSILSHYFEYISLFKIVSQYASELLANCYFNTLRRMFWHAFGTHVYGQHSLNIRPKSSLRGTTEIAGM